MFSGPKNSLGSPSPEQFSLLKLLFFSVPALVWCGLPHTSRASGTSREVSVVLRRCLYTLGPEDQKGEQQGQERGGSALLWARMGNLMCDGEAPSLWSWAVFMTGMKVALLAQRRLLSFCSDVWPSSVRSWTESPIGKMAT